MNYTSVKKDLDEFMNDRDKNGYRGKMEYNSGDIRFILECMLKYKCYLSYNLLSPQSYLKTIKCT